MFYCLVLLLLPLLSGESQPTFFVLCVVGELCYICVACLANYVIVALLLYMRVKVSCRGPFAYRESADYGQLNKTYNTCNAYIHIHIYTIYIYIYIHIYIYLSLYIYICIYTRIGIYVITCGHMHSCIRCYNMLWCTMLCICVVMCIRIMIINSIRQASDGCLPTWFASPASYLNASHPRHMYMTHVHDTIQPSEPSIYICIHDTIHACYLCMCIMYIPGYVHMP